MITIYGCGRTLHDVASLPSPDRKYMLYDYTLGGPMAFSSDQLRTTILERNQKFDYTTHNYFTFHGFPLIRGWRSDTLSVACIDSKGQPRDLLPYRTELRKWKDWYIEIIHYHGNAFGRDPMSLEGCFVRGDSVTFTISHVYKGKRQMDTLNVFRGQVTVFEADSTVYVRTLSTSRFFVRIDSTGRTLTGQPEVSLDSYELSPSTPLDLSKLYESGIFHGRKLSN